MPMPRSSILSWKDQVNKNNIKIIEPNLNTETKEERVKTFFCFLFKIIIIIFKFFDSIERNSNQNEH